MPEFKYKISDASGRTKTGRKLADSQEALILEFERDNFVVLSVEEIVGRKKSLRERLEDFRSRRGKVKIFDLVVFCKLLATMLNGGVPILNAVDSIANEIKNPRLKRVLREINRDLKEGKMFSESLRKYPDVFSTLFIAIVEAGEKVGSLDQMLRRLNTYLEARDRLIRKMRSATAYPVFIASFFILAITVITIFLIPRFRTIYEGFGAELPMLTQFVFLVSNFILKNIFFLIIIAIASVFSLFMFVTHTKRGRILFDSTKLKFPIFGEVIKKASVSKFCRTLSTLLEEGVSVTEGLLLVGRTAGNIIIEGASNKASKLVLEGETIPSAFVKMGIFPPLMLQMTKVGVESGSLPELLDKTADFYEEQVDIFIGALTSVIEPILVITLGSIIAVVVIALYLPIFRLTAALKGG